MSGSLITVVSHKVFWIVWFMCNYHFMEVYSECAEHPNINVRIINGQYGHITQFPYQAALLLKESNKHFCGGSIIGERFILTAAHCTMSFSVPDIEVRLGSTLWNSGGTLFDVGKIIQHPQFDSCTVENDIAILRLKGTIKWSCSIQPIKLPTSQNLEPHSGQNAIITGWGRTDLKKEGGSVHLMAATIPIAPLFLCKIIFFGQKFRVKSENICAGDILGGSSVHQGDSGGPLVVDGIQYGVTSWISLHFPTVQVFASVIAFENFIYEHTVLDAEN